MQSRITQIERNVREIKKDWVERKKKVRTYLEYKCPKGFIRRWAEKKIKERTNEKFKTTRSWPWM